MKKLTLSLVTLILALQLTACTDKEKPELKPAETTSSAPTSSTIDTPAANPTEVTPAPAPAPKEPKLDEATTEAMAHALENKQEPSEMATEPKQPASDEEEEKEPECE